MTPELPDIDRLRRRRGNKWGRYPPDVLPAWVADMDFPAARPILELLRDMVDLSDLGYPKKPPLETLYAALATRMEERHGWAVDPDRIEVIADVVQGIYIALLTLGEAGQGTWLQTPAYPPLLAAAAETDRPAVHDPLMPTADGYALDPERMERNLPANARFLLLCNPHNPTGRVFTRAELERLAEIALRRDLIILADEIHADLVYPPQRHLPMAGLAPEVAERTITFTSATKAFNIAGLRCAFAVFGSETLQRRFNTSPRGLRGGLNAFGAEATRVAWTRCDGWLASVTAYLDDSRHWLAETVAGKLPGIVCRIPESTYFAWIDCRELELNEEPYEFFLREAKVALMPGPEFGPEGAGWTRINFATSREILGQVVARMAQALAAR
jgi:cystathionine beta-lyase